MRFEPVHKRKYLTTKGIVTCTSRLAMQFLNLEQSFKKQNSIIKCRRSVLHRFQTSQNSYKAKPKKCFVSGNPTDRLFVAGQIFLFRFFYSSLQ